ncbi:DUF488 domain-containing protein [Rhizorhabdus sp. FW153]|uniref:DUF488 domain-containing protein n=1 Tax=Rhizorhabdus sp. FW153 TaxID=3400216 RepID=UPI003CEB4FBB
MTQQEFVDCLRQAGVEVLADVRAVPLSRRPGFSKNILAAGLREAGIDYSGFKALGTPAEGRAAARRNDLTTLSRIYADQLDMPDAIAQSVMLQDLARQRRTALLCFERAPACCHRSLLAQALFAGAEIIDLFP